MDIYAKGAKIRAKICWYEEGEKSSKYYFNFAQRNYNNKVINKIRHYKEITELQRILDQEKKIYAKL